MTHAQTPVPVPGSRKAPRGHSRIRADIEGLRAIGVFFVLPYHAGLMLFPGGFVGIDVFFVISGFVITAQLLRESDRTNRISLLGFYARRAKRLFPAAFLVLIATAIMTWLWVPRIKWEIIGGDITASALYYVNWWLVSREVDYLAEDSGASPLRHFWSLAVEEQFYFVWPIIFVLMLMLAISRNLNRRGTIAVGLGVILVASMIWAVYSVEVNPARAYFDTGVRAWEFTFGAFVALMAHRLPSLPKASAVAMTWLGLAMVLGSGLAYHDTMPWPGPWALIPCLGAALFIAGGDAAGKHGPVALVGNRFMLFIGATAYSTYLWHWPLMIVWEEHHGSMSVLEGMIIVVLTFIPAYLTFKLVENPMRSAKVFSERPGFALSMGFNFTLGGAIAGLVLILAFNNISSVQTPQSAEDRRTVAEGGSLLGAEALDDVDPEDDEAGVAVDSVDAFYPAPEDAQGDIPDLYADDCQMDTEATEVRDDCVYGMEDGTTSIAVVGDSKAAQWVPALEVLADTHDWRIEVYTKSSCPFVDEPVKLRGSEYTSCAEYRDNVVEHLIDTEVDVVWTVSRANELVTLDEQSAVGGFERVWSQLTDAGIRTVVTGDTPMIQPPADKPDGYFDSGVYACVLENLDSLTECVVDTEVGLERSGYFDQREAAANLGAFELEPVLRGGGGRPESDQLLYFLDLNPWVCPQAECAPVVGNVLLWRQGSHLTKTYIESLAPRVERALLVAGVPA